jgi:uncharacterized membrane protein YphA (DoxX/SURF4 family)
VLVALVILRLVIGFHFLGEGITKLDGSFSSAGFLANAKGPLAPRFQAMVWDAEGRHRLGMGYDDDKRLVIDVKPTQEAWESFRADVASHHRFDDKKKKESEEILKLYLAQYDWYVKTNRDDILNYFKELERRERQEQVAANQEVASLRQQGNMLASALRRDRAILLVGIEKMWSGLEHDLNNLAGDKNSSRQGLALKKLGRQGLDSITMNKIIPCFDLVVGACLIVGLLVPVVSVAGALFLLTVVVSQWPGAVGAAPVYYQVIEMSGLVLLAMMSAGRYAGLDYFVNYILRRRGKKKK